MASKQELINKKSGPDATGTAENKSNPIEGEGIAMNQDQDTSIEAPQVQRLDRADFIPLAMVLSSIRPDWDIVDLVDQHLPAAAGGRTLAQLAMLAVIATNNPNNAASVLKFPGRHSYLAEDVAKANDENLTKKHDENLSNARAEDNAKLRAKLSAKTRSENRAKATASRAS